MLAPGRIQQSQLSRGDDLQRTVFAPKQLEGLTNFTTTATQQKQVATQQYNRLLMWAQACPARRCVAVWPRCDVTDMSEHCIHLDSCFCFPPRKTIL